MKLRYVELPPGRIFNRLGIENHTAWLQLNPYLGDRWWSLEAIVIREKFAHLWIKEFDRITGHFTTLEESIRKHGMQRPVSAISGPPRSQRLNKIVQEFRPFPPSDQIPINEVVYTQPFGGSRVTIAQKFNITVPCAVHDFSNLFPDAPEITGENFRKWFGDEYAYTPSLPHLRIGTHSHIKKPEYKAMNQNTRRAQQQASRVAMEGIRKTFKELFEEPSDD